MKKRLISAALSVLLVFSGLFGTLAFAANAPSSWAADSVNAAISAGLVPENLQRNYTQPITRAEFCALAVALYENAAGEEITGRSTFTDTNDVNVEKMAFLGVVMGVGDGVFDPDRKITRQEAAALLARLAAVMGDPLPNSPVNFNDKGSISSWAVEDVGRVKSIGIMSGTGDNNFSPKGDYTREQSIATVKRLDDARFFRCEIKNTVDVTWRSPDKRAYGVYSYGRPVCSGSNTALVNAINNEFDSRERIFSAYERDSGPAAFYAESGGNIPYLPNDGLFYTHEVSTAKTYEGRGVISFCVYDYYYVCSGAHPFSDMDCVNFDRNTGKILSLDDVLMVNESNVSTVLYNEMLKGNMYHFGNRDYPMDAATVREYASDFKSASTLETPFYFASDGIHVFYYQYTVFYAFGESELIIPYSRTDLIRAPYAG